MLWLTIIHLTNYNPLRESLKILCVVVGETHFLACGFVCMGMWLYLTITWCCIFLGGKSDSNSDCFVFHEGFQLSSRDLSAGN